ncbi:ABC transporter permease [Bacillus sp. FJAT-50079]|uniref:ABC transporter permease n=1 Tax=Bacillus sp. FJAT-50079 TaxID=2833577 RepID=UPI001BC92FEB|nr:ABC transporter permease [Bacillus sp. FJAT-50079]MBS4207184.1 ABC transporter permease [Bacillus sp. FJAT-50079]
MNIVNKLTIRHLRQNKKRTLVTMIGVIISVAMITAVATLAVSFLDLVQRQTIANEGEWHVLYKDVNKAQLEAIKKDEATKAVVMSRNRGYATLAESQNENKPYLFIKEYNAQGFQQFPIELSEGRLPEAENEVVISEDIASNANVHYKIGDQLTVEVGNRVLVKEDGINQELLQNDSLIKSENGLVEVIKNKKIENYHIVGTIKRPVWEPTWSPGYTIITYVDERMMIGNDTIDAIVVLKKVRNSLYKHAKKLAEKTGIESVSFNNNLLRYYGVTNNGDLSKTLYSLATIIMVIIIIGAVSLIYNAFAISVSERSRHLGMLASVGATKKQKRNSVFFEGSVIGVISIPIGIICGLVGIGVTFFFINSTIQGALGVTEKLNVTITPLSIIAACGVSCITIFISAYLPAIKASRISAIDAIRQTTDVKLTRKAVKTSKLVRQLFGIEAEIGLKNLKRNRRRYQATVFSLVISIILFLTVSFFTANLQKSVELSQIGVNHDIQIANGSVDIIDDQFTQSVASLHDVTEYSVIHMLSVNAMIEEAKMSDKLLRTENSEAFPYSIQLYGLDDQSLKKYASQVGADYKQLIDPQAFSGIVIDTIPYEDPHTGKYVETKAIHTKVGDRIDLVDFDWEKEETHFLNTLHVSSLTDQFPMGVYPAGLGNLGIVISEKVMRQVFDDEALEYMNTDLFLKSSDPMKTQQEIEEMKDFKIMVHNVYHYRQQEEQLIMLMSVFTYGFIVLITAISIANIFNTISTSISLRKREFAMLKSVGMTPNSFNKMIHYESIFYGMKSLLYGLPISVAVMYLIYKALMNSFEYGFALPWISALYVIIAVFIITGAAMLYSSAKVKKENIIDALKQENI